MICSSDVFQEIVQSPLFKGHNTDQNFSGSEKSWNEKKNLSVTSFNSTDYTLCI